MAYFAFLRAEVHPNHELKRLFKWLIRIREIFRCKKHHKNKKKNVSRNADDRSTSNTLMQDSIPLHVGWRAYPPSKAKRSFVSGIFLRSEVKWANPEHERDEERARGGTRWRYIHWTNEIVTSTVKSLHWERKITLGKRKRKFQKNVPAETIIKSGLNSFAIGTKTRSKNAM